MARTEEGAVLHCVVLVSCRDDCPGWHTTYARISGMLTNIQWWTGIPCRTYRIIKDMCMGQHVFLELKASFHNVPIEKAS